MYNLDKNVLEAKATESGFIRDNLEKVYRLTDVLAFINEDPLLSESLVLKGGTAINLTVFHLPRLSVDIDLDFHRECSREEMLVAREEINSILLRYMNASGYMLNTDRAKNPHSLDSWVFYYQNAGGNRDNIKVEINYSMRSHVLLPQKTRVNVSIMDTELEVCALAPIELFGSKIKALLERTAPRDMYDIHNMIRFGIFDESEQEMLRKCTLFYRAVGSTGDFHEDIDVNAIGRLTFSKIRQTLLPVLRKSEKIDLDSMKGTVQEYLREFLALTEAEKAFLHEFSVGNYQPALLFDDEEIIRRVQAHPMAVWKSEKIRQSLKSKSVPKHEYRER